jgi:hypothetical protein
MASFLNLLKSRVLPALLTAFGVVLVTAGLLSYVDPTTAGTAVVATPEIIEPTEEPSETPSPTPSPSVAASASPSAEPTASPEPTKKPTAREVATRVVVPALKIDLPVIRGNDEYPYCNVAMYLSSSKKASQDVFGQPGEGRVTYIYAHARDGMFGPIFNLAIDRGTPKKMIGMLVQVYTNRNRMFLYEIRQVRTNITSLDAAIARNKEEVWLQTSEGPKGTRGKTQVLTKFLSVEDSTKKESRPKAKPVRCG